VPETLSNSQSYYEILGVPAQATSEEIQRSFRRLVKEYHPDRNRGRQEWASRRVRLILEAYRTLRDAQKRFVYDQSCSPRPPLARPESVRPQSRRPRPMTLYDRAEMILFDLVAGNGGDAVSAYEALCQDHKGFSLLTYLSVRDYLDCSFLLGEEYERQGDFERAVKFYEEVYNEEREEPRRRYFFDEVRDRMRNLYCRQMAPSSPPAVALGYYKRLLEMGLGKAEEAFFQKKMAECYYMMGDYATARITLDRAFSLKPKLKGAQKICLKLGAILPNPPRTLERQ